MNCTNLLENLGFTCAPVPVVRCGCGHHSPLMTATTWVFFWSPWTAINGW